MKNLILFFLFFASACVSPQVAINPRADFSKIKRVAVLSFKGNKGEVASDMLSQALLRYGADVIERQRLDDILKEQNLTERNLLDPETTKKIGKLLGVDAIFLGSVIDLKSDSKYIVQTNSTNPQNNISSVSGKNIYMDGSVAGFNDAQILSTTAEVSLSVRLVDIESGSIMWSAYMSYEGFDITSAMSSISNFFVKSLLPIWPQLRQYN
jgi:curli biogenesis system outer membrane secretion channel CsgG